MQTQREILILDSPEIGCPLVLQYVYLELCDAYKRKGHVVRVITTVSEIHDNSIVFLGDKIKIENPQDLLFGSNAIFIGWYWKKWNVSNLKYFIHVYENNTNNLKNVFYQNIRNHCPLLLRANEDPDKIGTYERTVVRDYCYMGWRYKPEFEPTSFHGMYHGIKDHTKFLPYEERKQIYLSSTFALGFQSEFNIYYEHVSQRIYEGLAYGCIVFSESLPACDQTNGIVVHIISKNDLEDKMKYYLSNPEELKKKQNDGYEFIRKYGTNEVSVQKINDVINGF